ncbi:Predicted kinase [Sulfobacillus thermosulfidooxidans DSM 9293]|uniref:Predicted kinase n=1 Tax=Sulfobacillus thermosulfidooxidans (strain DSM 9293 / VKM B-1269 / AT-1) TaxID=929705 RepID=A0A1W1WKS1_SULTA|nr:AAA family ATPase [Sulfobacillus thermosulfidooxidans]SMC06782.1 Predicted kinase [Sulfobacillus thermosulfidooxidans DSM 9293]
MYILVNGLPGSGKSTLAAALGHALQWPVLEKDVFKEVLFDELGIDDRQWSRKLGMISITLMYRLAKTMPHAILDSVFDRHLAPRDLAELKGPMVEIYCDCPPFIAEQRFQARQMRSRHEGHIRGGINFSEWIEKAGEPLAIYPVLRVDTTRPVNLMDALMWIAQYNQET